ncbi:MAG: DUF484 family protein [Alphaproteobacteria bacterium]|nr:DUF484 family protein [Alphaproteobacteria bacterium SS10]
MASDVADQKLSDAQVRAYLRANPDFFQANDDLLSALNLPARPTGEGIADFQKFLVDRLRKEGEELKAEQGDLIANARANMNTQNRVHSAILFLLDARNFEQFITTITTDLAVLLDVDTVVLAVESTDLTLPGVNQPGIRVVPNGTVDLWLGAKTVRLDSGVSGDPTLLGPASDLVQSQAMIRLDVDPRMPVGMLILGSRTPEMFDPGQGTELAQFLGRVVERQLRHWLQV